jgi:site-specific DNA recombinase
LKLDVKVVSVTEPIDAKPEGKLLETILAGFAQFDNDIRAARTLQGMRRKIQEGISPWRPPLGYKSGSRPGSKKTVPDEPDQPTFGLLQQAWNEFATGRYTKSQVLQLLTSRGLRARTGKHLSKQSLDYVFSDLYYAGILRDPWAGQEHIGRHMPMVSRTTFDAVQQIVAGRGHSVPHRVIRPEFPLRTCVRCICCERTLTGAFSRGRSGLYPYYRCYYQNCDSHGYYPSASVHEEFIGFLNAMSKDRHSVDHLKELVLEASRHRMESSWELNEKKTVETKRIKEQQQQLMRMKMDQLITDQEFVAQRSLLASRLSELETSTPDNWAEPEDVLRGIEAICVPVTDLGGAWDSIATEFKRRFQHLALPAGYVFGRIGTAQKGRLFSFLEAFDTPKTDLVPLTGQSWNQLVEEIKAFAAIFRDAANPEFSEAEENMAA